MTNDSPSQDNTNENSDRDEHPAHVEKSRSIMLDDLPESVSVDVRHEDLRMYTNRGLYPIDLGRPFAPNNRFRVVAKLGHGGYGTVWLCEDRTPVSGGPPAWKAVKVLTARQSTENCPELQVMKRFHEAGYSCADALERGILIPEDHVWIDGARDQKHVVLVMPLMGSDLANVADAYKFEAAPLKRFCRQATKALGFLHSLGVCHGDIRPANMLFQLKGVEHLSEDELFEIIGPSICIETDEVFNHMDDELFYELDEGDDGDSLLQSFPNYLVLASRFPLDSKYMTGDIVLADLGVAYEVYNPPRKQRTPSTYRDPGWADGGIEVRASFGPEIWSLGVAIMEIRQGYGAVADEDWHMRFIGAFKTGRDLVVPVEEGEKWEDLDPIMRDDRPGYKIVRVVMSTDEADKMEDLLVDMLWTSPEDRPPVAELLEYSWFQEAGRGEQPLVDEIVEHHLVERLSLQ